MNRHSPSQELAQQVLQDSYLQLHLRGYEISEDLQIDPGCTIHLRVEQAGQPGSEEITLSGQGVGVIDAAYRALIDYFVESYPSLRTLSFTGFRVQGHLETGLSDAGADALASVELSVRNQEGTRFHFEAKGRSILAASVDVVLQVGQFFINSERAFITVHNALLDAQSRYRGDLVERYTRQLSELVKNTSYTEVIDRIRSELL